MRSSFLDYAMSVIVSRALPDVRDGLKPVHRRVLFAMHEAGLQPNRPRLKCARVVGDVMGSYHPPRRRGDLRHARPHGAAVLDALPARRRARNFETSTTTPLRRCATQCRLTRLATELLRDIDADTVDFVPNYDESRRQPSVLPSRTRTCSSTGRRASPSAWRPEHPPHNLGEVVDALVALIDDPEIDVDRLTRHVKGPDFPTGGIIVTARIREAYRSGRGRIVMRARAHVEELRGARPPSS
jgi:DNA gyrase subunit A